MPITAAQLVAKVEVTGDTEAKAKLQNVSEKVKETSGGFKSMLGNALSFAAGGAIFAGLGFLKNQIGGIFTESMNAQAGLAQTNEVLKSTHDVSGMTANAVLDLATQYSHLTKFSDDTVQSAENMLLTFTNIGKNVFPQATKTVLDMSQALGQDTKSSAIQLGKALGDPLTGITALQRVGVTFSQVQKDQIKNFMATNNIAGAQGIILKELQKEFGGSAEAAGKTFGGQLAILQQRLDDVKQNIGDALMPVLIRVVGFLSNNIGPAFDALGGAIQAAGKFLAPFGYFLQYVGSVGATAFKNIGDTLTQVGQIFKSVFSGLNTSGDNPIVMFFSNILGKAYPIIGQLGSAFHGFMIDMQKALSTINPQAIISALQPLISIVGGALSSNFKLFGQLIQQVGQWFKSTMLPAIQAAMPGFEKLGSVIFTQLVPALLKIWAVGEQVGRAILPVLIKAFETIAPIVVRVGGFLANLLGQALQFVIPYIVQAAQQIGKFAGEIATRLGPIIQWIGDFIKTILGGIMDHWTQIWGALGPIVLGVFNLIKSIIQTAWAVISGIFKIALDILSGNWSRAWNDLKDMLGGIWDGIKGIVKAAWDIVTGILSGAWKGIQAIWGGISSWFNDHVIGPIKQLWQGLVDWFKGNPANATTVHTDVTGGTYTGGYAAPYAHAHALGTSFAPGGLSLLGEREPEMVLGPSLGWLARGSQVIPMSQMGGGGYSGPNTIILQVDGYQFARILMPHIANNIRIGVGTHGR